MKCTFHVDREVLNHLNRSHQTEAQLWLYLPGAKEAECFPVIIPQEQTGDESYWEAPLANFIKLSLTQAKRIKDLEKVEKAFNELCQLAGGESRLRGMVMATKAATPDSTDTNQSSNSTYRTNFLKGKC